MLEVLNLGAGVQSSTVLLMSIVGELPKLDMTIFADTGWEPAAVYRQFDWLKQQAESAGIPIHVVTAGNIKEDALTAQRAGGSMGQDAEAKAKALGAHQQSGRWASMPYFVLGPNGERGQIRRQCTSEYKIRPIEQFLRREVMGLASGQRSPREQVMRRWYGISSDESRRMRFSDDRWAKNWYPLVERGMTRLACHDWLRANGYPEAPRSACIGCPFHSSREWREMERDRPDEWRDVVEFDRLIRKCGGMRGDLYLHADRVPLNEAALWKDEMVNQMRLPGMADECLGHCGT